MDSQSTSTARHSSHWTFWKAPNEELDGYRATTRVRIVKIERRNPTGEKLTSSPRKRGQGAQAVGDSVAVTFGRSQRLDICIFGFSFYLR